MAAAAHDLDHPGVNQNYLILHYTSHTTVILKIMVQDFINHMLSMIQHMVGVKKKMILKIVGFIIFHYQVLQKF